MLAGAALWTNVSPQAAQAAQTSTLTPVADTTYTQVWQDGDNSVKTTLATCPALCDGNTQGERDAFVEFQISALPANAVNIKASFEIYAWNATAARITAYPAAGGASSPGTWADRPALGAPLATHASVVAGYNAFDVSSAVVGNGTLTIALLQETRNTRVYWASKENSNTAIRPRLVLSYDLSPGWSLVWSDEFNGTALDTTKWRARNNTRVDYDLACITSRPENLFVSGGLLTLRARHETYTCGETRNYTVAYIDTIGKRSFTYGRFEIRAKSPNGPTNSKGLWPAFWMRPDDGGNGEIDVVELPGGSQYYQASTVAIFRDYTPTKQDYRYTFPSGYPGDGFHTYTTEWENGALRWYVDGVLIWTRTPSTTPWFDEVFHKPYNLRLNFQVGGWLGNPDGATVFPADFQVDYVRVWQR